MSFEFERLDWERLDRLRKMFLGGEFSGTSYWRDEEDLAVYDPTFGERIGWKWDAVLGALKNRGWRPPVGCYLWDWGCGSGIAGRRILAEWPGDFRGLALTDHSPLAVDFAAKRVNRLFPELPVQRTEPTNNHEKQETPYILAISHVWNELNEDSRKSLVDVAAGAAAVLWVEPGVPAVARALQRIRDDWMLQGQRRVLGPCTHVAGCGLLRPGNEAHWCHHFAEPPSEIFATSDWVRFGQRAGVDLRALPYSFLAVERTSNPNTVKDTDGIQRLLGQPKVFKGYARALFCGELGVKELELQQRVAPTVYKSWSKGRGGEFYQIQTDTDKPGRIKKIEPNALRTVGTDGAKSSTLDNPTEG